MANVIERSTMQFLPSVNTPDYPEKDYLISPDLSAVSGVPQKYWTIIDEKVVPLTKEEQTAKDAAITAEIESKSSACPYGLREKCEYCPQ